MLDKIIVDADLCIKLGCSERYHFLTEVLPLVAREIYMHKVVYGEVKYPKSSKLQLDELIQKDIIKVVDESMLNREDAIFYNMTYNILEKVMINPINPNKNKGEVCSLAYAKVTKIPIFATDESNLQPIIDSFLNTGMDDDIRCLRIVDIIELIKKGDISLQRKYAKALWRISNNGSNANLIFDEEIWPLGNNIK